MKAVDRILTVACEFAEKVTPAPDYGVILEHFQKFLANISERESSGWLVTHPKAVKNFLTDHIDLLTAWERFRLYGMMSGFFAHCFMDVLTSRLVVETDPKCQELLRVIAEIHNVRSPSSN
jgi:hypothetical protein